MDCDFFVSSIYKYLLQLFQLPISSNNSQQKLREIVEQGVILLMKLSMATNLVAVFLAFLVTMAAFAHALPEQTPEAVESWFKRLHHAKEKLTKLHFYFQDVVSGPHPTAVEIARANMTATSPTFFGLVRAFDDPLTVEGDPSSRRIGYGQGIYALTSQEDLSLLFTFNFYFTEGKYSGSTLSVQGRNPLEEKYREMSIIGGTGVFRLARGSALASTYWANATTQDGIVEFTLFVQHYEELDYGSVDDM